MAASSCSSFRIWPRSSSWSESPTTMSNSSPSVPRKGKKTKGVGVGCARGQGRENSPFAKEEEKAAETRSFHEDLGQVLTSALCRWKAKVRCRYWVSRVEVASRPAPHGDTRKKKGKSLCLAVIAYIRAMAFSPCAHFPRSPKSSQTNPTSGVFPDLLLNGVLDHLRAGVVHGQPHVDVERLHEKLPHSLQKMLPYMRD